MAELVLNVSKVNSYVIPNIRKIEELMQEAYSTSNTLKSALPSTFNYRSNVSDIVNEIYDIKKEVSKVNTLINEKITQAERIENIGGNKISSMTTLIHELNKESYAKNNESQTKVNEQKNSVSEVEEQSALEWVGEKIDGAIDFAGEILENTGSFICDLGSTIWDGITSAWNWFTDDDNLEELLESLGASISNAVISFSKGVVDLVESIGDTCVMIGTGVESIGTALYDVGYGIVTKDWSFDATKELWKGAKTVVSYDWSNKIYDSLYDTKAGKWLDEHAYAPFKSDGVACKVVEGIGYVAGVVTVSSLTFGAGAPVLAGVSGFAGLGKYTQEEWNKNSISLNYGGQDIELPINYEKYKEIEGLKIGEQTTIGIEQGDGTTINLTLTSKGNGKYDIIDDEGNIASLNSLNESSTLKGLAVGAVEALWESAQWYTGSKINGMFKGVNSAITNRFIGSLTRVGLDTTTAAVEVPFQSLVTMLSEGKSWSEAWQEQGGWQTVGSQVAIGAISSAFGETTDFLGSRKALKKITSEFDNVSNNSDKVIAEQLNKMTDLDVKKMLDGMDDLDKLRILEDLDYKRVDIKVDQMTKILNSSDDNVKMVLSTIDDRLLLNVVSKLDINNLDKIVTECIISGDIARANLVFKNISDQDFNLLLKHFKERSSGNIPYLMKNVFNDNTDDVIKRITDEDVLISILNSFKYDDISSKMDYISKLNMDQLKSMYLSCDGFKRKQLFDFMSIDQAKELLKGIDDNGFKEILDQTYKDDEYYKLFICTVSSDKLKMLVSKNDIKTANLLLKLCEQNQDISHVISLIDDKNLNSIMWNIPNESKIKFLDSITDSNELNRTIKNIGYNDWKKLIYEGLKSNDLSDVLKYVDNYRLAQIIETIDMFDAYRVIGAISPEQLKYLKDNLEGTVKIKLAVDYQIKELYDPRIANLVDFAENDMVNNFKNKFGQFISKEKFKTLDGSYEFLGEERFNAVSKNPLSMAFNNGSVSTMNLVYCDSIVKSNVSHESIHQLSVNDFIDANGNHHTARGLSIDKQNVGINECATEYLNELSMGSEYHTSLTGEFYSGYQEGVMRLKKLINFGIVDEQKFIKSYFSNDLSYLESEITKLTKDKSVFEEMMRYFDDAISGDGSVKSEALDNLDKLISNLIMSN